MAGRGRPRKAVRPDTMCARGKIKPEEMKQEPLPRCPGKQNGTTKEQKPRAPKKTTHTEEKPSLQRTQTDKTTNHVTEKIKRERTTTETTKAPVQGAKAKTCAGKTKSLQKISEELEVKPGVPEDSLKTTKAKKCGGEAKSPEQVFEELEVKPGVPKDTPKAKPCAGKTKSPEEISEEAKKMQPGTPEDIKKAGRHKDKASVDSVLRKTLTDLTIKKGPRSDAARVVNNITDAIIAHLKETQCFKEAAPLRTGSYYENLKISDPDEFDVMLYIPVDRVKVIPFRDDGAFYSVALKRGNNPLKKFEENDILSASKMLTEFREEVKKCVKKFKEWEVTKKKTGCPAVTLTTTVQSITISLDVVLSINVKSSWPPFTQDGMKIEGWLGTKVKQQYKREGYYLVPKYEGKGIVEIDGVLAKDVWRISFSHVEKEILKSHGSEKTCCETGGARCCRKDCLKLLKHLLSLLKKEDSTFEKFCSYLAKTTLLRVCCTRTKDTDWSASSLSVCFQLLLKDFVAYLEDGVLYNFFIPTQNLLSGLDRKKCSRLACRIRDECDTGFPIFK